MKKIIFYFVISLIAIACNSVSQEDCTNYDYSDCNTIAPDSGLLNINLTINGENSKVPIAIYKGKYENGNKISEDTLTVSTASYSLPVNNYYSVRAKYKSQNKIIFAIDGGEITVKKNYICDSTCWSVKSANADVRLK
ncbi:MAG: hypothetical protein WCK02_10140 [Bacteroidota bacterium]